MGPRVLGRYIALSMAEDSRTDKKTGGPTMEAVTRVEPEPPSPMTSDDGSMAEPG
ncbi:hypothetical protein AArcMg_3528 [Natrarchaeobaculum sulfurireducens]|uniref:Uncharacterized protein n=1 Tax=Natrarchaeobaculum sulfurireducens TaxID=2044521 RepID=A0A346PVF6_9EURY|nr:hypothetical protein AArc1_3471 [Natrarchaeobaculum sulfurireducens]AXR83501.1 hypothetical protein AArcMg_3528 [Natrarchaeobaculum sulfurireducens]